MSTRKQAANPSKVLANFAAATLAALFVCGAHAQQKAAPAAAPAPTAPAAAPAASGAAPGAPPPSWQQGRSSEQASSTLHPFAPHMTGRQAAELPIEKLKVPPGFK